MKLEWTSPLFVGIMALVLAPKQKKTGKKRLFWILVTGGCFLLVFAAAEFVLQI
jgi:hypothetical protein